MITQGITLLFGEESHGSVEVIGACEIQQGGTILVFGIDLDVNSSVAGRAGNFANAHIHLATVVAKPACTKTLLKEAVLLQAFEQFL